ncbi:MAG: hypothetical protein Pg6C_01870 [Treponemataceae bacterium]|nr:MAG: hypothetical protein Pg6C_01870 [Treponemataceae bacterium]
MSDWREFHDEYGNSYIVNLKNKLADGGQGCVYRTNIPNVLLKLATKDGSPLEDEESIKNQNEKYSNVMLLPIPENCRLAAPRALLRQAGGYVMSLLDDMTGIDSLLANTVEELLPQYIKTGGARRRLELLGNAAGILSRLHGAGLVYGDISPGNTFVSSSPDFTETWFIDADNLCIQNKAGYGGCAYTEDYAAPEIVKGLSCCTAASDVYAFAAMAFESLAMMKPFNGVWTGRTDSSEPAWDAEGAPEAGTEGGGKACLGELPFIDDPEDDTNRNEYGVRRDYLFGSELARLFARTFSKEGRASPWERPAIYEWPKAFFRSADSTARCGACGFTYQYRPAGKCPLCQKPAGLVLKMETWLFNGLTQAGIKGFHAGAAMGICGNIKPIWTFAREISGAKPAVVPKRVLSRFLLDDHSSPLIKISVDAPYFSVTLENAYSNEQHYAIYGSEGTSGFRPLYGSLRMIPVPKQDDLFLLVVFDKDTGQCRICKITFEGKQDDSV